MTSTGVVCVLSVVMLRLCSGYCQSEQIVEDRVGSVCCIFRRVTTATALNKARIAHERIFNQKSGSLSGGTPAEINVSHLIILVFSV